MVAVVLMPPPLQDKLYTYPPGLCVRLYDLLASHVAEHYAQPRQFSAHTAAAVRKMVSQTWLSCIK